MKLAQKLKNFKSAYIERFPQTSNNHANALATFASIVKLEIKITIEVEFMLRPSIEADRNCNMVCDVKFDLGVCQMDQIIHYFNDKRLPTDTGETHRIRAQASQYQLSPDQKFYRRSFSGPYLKCVHPQKMQSILLEFHEGRCGSHTGGQSLAHRPRCQSYWWPYMQDVAYTKK